MPKYRKRAVLSLSEQALISFGSELVTNLSQLLKENANEKFIIREIRKYLDIVGADSRVRQELLDLIATARPAMPYNVRGTCFAILLDKSTTVFGTHILWDVCNTRLWKLMARQCANLRQLDLQNTHLPIEEMRYFEKILRNNQKITQLTLPWSVKRDEMRQLIDKYCKNLRHLSLSEHDRIIAVAEFLSQSQIAQTLTRINFNLSDNIESEIYMKAVALILQTCPNIEMFQNFAYIGTSLKLCQAKDADFKCNLKKLHDTDTTQDVMATIVKTCPKLKRLFLIAPRYGSLQALENTEIEELTVEETFDCAELMKLLKKNGKHLLCLVLRGSSECLYLCELSKNCPLLVKLEIEFLTNIQIETKNHIFEHLQELRIYQSILSKPVLVELFKSAQNLSSFQIDQAAFDDECMKVIFMCCNFKNLKEFKIDVAPHLTVNTVKLLLYSCPKLQTLGSLAAWNLTTKDIKSLNILQVVDGPGLQLKMNYYPEDKFSLMLR